MKKVTSRKCRIIIDDFILKNDSKEVGLWGIGSYGTIGLWDEIGFDENRLRKLGLKCTGGGSYGAFNGQRLETYNIYNIDKSFYMELSRDEFDNVDRIYNIYLRRYKLKRLNEVSEQV